MALDYAEHVAGGREFVPTHYAFLVTEEEFDAIFARIQERELSYWADPLHSRPQEINTLDGGRGLYLNDPDGHNMEFLTRRSPTPRSCWPVCRRAVRRRREVPPRARTEPPSVVISGTSTAGSAAAALSVGARILGG